MDHPVNVRDYLAMERENDAFMKEGREVALHGSINYPGESSWLESVMITREVAQRLSQDWAVVSCGGARRVCRLQFDR